LTGKFSAEIATLCRGLIDLRVQVEACIDFPEEEIDAEDRRQLSSRLDSLCSTLNQVKNSARQGAVLREGLTVVLVGRPNVGKSSLLNRLAGDELAIVSPLPGTTRDYVRATIAISGVPVHLIDTAGLRATQDDVERIGIARTWAAIDRAGAALFITEAGEPPGAEEEEIAAKLPVDIPVARIFNKVDLAGLSAGRADDGGIANIAVSARTGEGVELIREWLLETAGWKPSAEGVFMARQRHLQALQRATEHMEVARARGTQFELFAEELRLAQRALSSRTGEFTSDDLLGEIFSNFCIGK
jgi:tRNA modification GTPase